MINSKKKGSRGELEAVNQFKEAGMEARRTQQYCGDNGDSDIIVDDLTDFFFEVKRCEKVFLESWLYVAQNQSKGKIPAIIHRRNKEKWKVTLYLKDFLTIARLFADMRPNWIDARVGKAK